MCMFPLRLHTGSWKNVELLNRESVYWRFVCDSSTQEWGYRFTITASIPGAGHCDRLHLELSNVGGVSPLLNLTGLPDQELRSMASQALTTLSGLEVARKEIDRQNGMDPLLQSLHRLYFKALATVSVGPTERDDGSVKATIPAGRVIAVDQQIWRGEPGSGAKPDLATRGVPRGRVVYPRELEGWVTMSPEALAPLPVERNSLVLLAMLSLEPNNREKLVEQGKIKLLLQLTALDEPVCKRVAAIALDEIADRPDKVRSYTTHLHMSDAVVGTSWDCA